ncbi:unnamed protein product, partial [Closterium sp. NIES-53]
IGHGGVLPRVVPFAFFLDFIHFFVRQQRSRLYLRRIRQLLESPLQPPDLSLELFPSCPQRVPWPAVTVLLPVPAIGHGGVLPRVVPFAFFLGFIHFFVRQQRSRLYLRRIRQLLESPLQPPDLSLELFPSCPQRVPWPAVTVLLPVPAFPALLTCRRVGAVPLQVPVLSIGVTKLRVGSAAAPRCGIGYRRPDRLRPTLSL